MQPLNHHFVIMNDDNNYPTVSSVAKAKLEKTSRGVVEQLSDEMRKSSSRRTAPRGRGSRSRTQHQRARVDKLREDKGIVASQDLAKILHSKLYPGVSSAQTAAERLEATSTKRAITICITTRSMGFGTISTFLALMDFHNVPARGDVYQLYRVALAVFESKMQVCQETVSVITDHLSYYLHLDNSASFMRNCRSQPILPDPISRSINALGVVKTYDSIYYPRVAAARFDSRGRFIPQSERVLYSNLRETVSALADNTVSVEHRRRFHENNPIPGCIWSPDHLLMNPDDIMPADFALDNLIQDFEDVEAKIAFLSRKAPRYFTEPVNYTTDGSKAILASNFQSGMKIRDRNVNEPLNDYVSRVRIDGDITDFDNLQLLTGAEQLNAALCLLGERPLSTAAMYPFYENRGATCALELKMSTEYSRSVLKMVVAQICQTIGWHSINSTPLEFMVDLMQEYILRTAKLTHQYAEILGRTEANLDDVGLAFQHMNIDMQELSDYIKNVDAVPYPMAVPKFPIRRESHLNFLKPGSREVVTRPMHVHEHLPAMYPNTEEDYITEKSETLLNGSSDLSSNNGTSTNSSMSASPHRMSPQVVFKRPGDPVSFESPIVKRVKVVEEGRPLREIHSVMMTTSGFLSPAREGKLPEARTPHQTRPDSPQSSSYPMVPPELKYDKKPKKIIKKGLEDGKLDKENKKKNRAKELFKPNKADDNKTKKLVGMKELAKLKALKPGGGKSQGTAQGSSSRPSTPKIISPKTTGSPKLTKKTEPKVKPEKVIDVAAGPPPVERKEDTIDKLPSEPDKQKLNIFKKISKPREDKEKDTSEQHKYKELDSRESSPGLIIDENNDKQALRNDTEVKHEEKKAPHTPDVHIHPDGGELIDLPSPGSDVYMFDDMSPPGTPSTPRTPELNMPPTPTDHKKKRKEKISKKKELKSRSPKHCTSPKKTKLSNDPVEVDILDRPKTPQAPEPPLSKEPVFPSTIPFPFFSAFPPAPGLIPHPMFPRFPLPLGRGGPGPHPAMPNLPLPPRFMNLPVKSEDFPNVSKNKIVDREKPVTPLLNESVPLVTKHEKLEKEKEEKPKIVKQDKEILIPAPMNTITMPSASTLTPVTYPPPVPAVPLLPTKNTKVEKLDKNEKKSKEHKKEKKDKLKKKKDKKEKHKEKPEKVKEKKEKVDKKEKIEKVKEKKEKKDKRKEKEKEDKNSEAVPKITLKLGGTASPRPPTPDAVPMKKLTIKTVVKKPEDETKREPSPELAKISALVTRPPKQKSASKKTEEGTLDGSPALPTDTFSANLTSVPLATVPRAKKSLFKALPQREPPPPHFDPPPNIPSVEQQPPFYFDQGGRQVWICPACGNQDDGSPMVGCDDCDAWYHWVCVGMQVPPATSENWYCRFCIAKKQELHHDKKKKKRKKKVKVTA